MENEEKLALLTPRARQAQAFISRPARSINFRSALLALIATPRRSGLAAADWHFTYQFERRAATV